MISNPTSPLYLSRRLPPFLLIRRLDSKKGTLNLEDRILNLENMEKKELVIKLLLSQFNISIKKINRLEVVEEATTRADK